MRGDNVQSLNGLWKMATDPENVGRSSRWFEAIPPGACDAQVPCVIQQVFPGYHGVAWHWRMFRLACHVAPGHRLLLRFGAVDYLAEVWVNGHHAGKFEGGETPFEFDVTDLVDMEGENLLAVRVLNPTDEEIDGYTLSQVPHHNKTMTPSPGSSFNYGGITHPVELRSVPGVYVADLFVAPDPASGDIAIHAWIQNATGAEMSGALRFEVGVARAAGDVLQAAAAKATFAPGESRHGLTLRVSQPHLWSLDDPFLYRVTVTVSADGLESHQQSVRCGFRDFRIIGGFFYLNGKRIFMKSAHTGNHMPIGLHIPVEPDHMRRDIINAKASGFNTMRFIAGAAHPDQLDFCDEIGMLVVEESFASWLLGGAQAGYNYGPQSPVEPDPKVLKERFEHSYSQVIKRDRNHPCVVVWQLLNETGSGMVFDIAREYLPKLRELDPTRLVLLNSGRFDHRFNVGSASNPGGCEWEHVWGAESPDAPDETEGRSYPSRIGAGDFHFYPVAPQHPEADALIRSLGQGTKPVFLSEYGIGSLYDVLGELRHYEQVGAREDLEDVAWLKEVSDALRADWKRLGLDSVYPFPEDMLRESQRLNARQRTKGFNLIRSNPNLCGFNATGMLDHAMCGEGLWKFWREFKPEMFDALCDGWSPLRWCLFVDPVHAYAGREVTVEAVLATEDALAPGVYPASFCVFGPHGLVWQKRADVTLAEPLQLAVPVIKESIVLDGPPGVYTFAANLERGGYATGGTWTFWVSDPVEGGGLQGSAALWGIDPRVQEWLEARGLLCRPFSATSTPAQAPGATEGGVDVILVGDPADWEDGEMWGLLRRAMDRGATVVFLSARLFRDRQAALEQLPLKQKGRCRYTHDWLYHKECVANRHPVFAGLQAPGVMDMDYYGLVIPHEIFEGLDTPDETICAGFATGNPGFPRGYSAHLVTALYRAGKGRFILNTMYLLENLEKNPAADRLLVNLVRYAVARSR